MIKSKKIISLPRSLSGSECAVRAFSGLSAGERGEYAAGFTDAPPRRGDIAETVPEAPFMQSAQNADEILY